MMRKITTALVALLLVVTPASATIFSFDSPSLKEIQEGYNSGDKYQRYPGVKRRENGCPIDGFLFCQNVKVGTVLPRIVDTLDLYKAAKKKQEVRTASLVAVTIHFPIIAEIARQNQVEYEWLLDHLVINAYEDERGDVLRSIQTIADNVVTVTEEQLERLSREAESIAETVADPVEEVVTEVERDLQAEYDSYFTNGQNADDFINDNPGLTEDELAELEANSE